LSVINSTCPHLFPPRHPLLLSRFPPPHPHPLSGASPLRVLSILSFFSSAPSSLPRPSFLRFPLLLPSLWAYLPPCLCFLLLPPWIIFSIPLLWRQVSWTSPPFLLLRLAGVPFPLPSPLPFTGSYRMRLPAPPHLPTPLPNVFCCFFIYYIVYYEYFYLICFILF